MRGLGLGVLALAAAACARDNPAFGDDAQAGGATSAASGGASTGPATNTSSVSGGASTSTGSTSSAGSSDDSTTGGKVVDAGIVQVGWWDESFGQRIPIHFEPRPGDLEGFVARVPIDAGDVFGGVQAEQLAFVDPLTQSRVGAEVTQFDPVRGQLEAWVQVPHWDSEHDTTLYLYFGARAPALAQRNPWSEHVAVWHLDNVTVGGTPDSVGGAQAVHAGNALAVPQVQEGKVGNALSFDGENDRYRAQLERLPTDDTFLVSAWVNADNHADEGSLVFARGGYVGPTAADTEWLLHLRSDIFQARMFGGEGSMPAIVGASALPEEAWQHYAVWFSGEELVVFSNGARRASARTSFAPFSHGLSWVSLGGYALDESDQWSTRLLDGRLDEVRWRNGAGVSDDWVALLFENQDDPSATLTPGPIETL